MPAAAPVKTNDDSSKETVAKDGMPERFEFDHKLFRSSEEALFRRSSDGSKEPVFVLSIEGSEFALPFAGILREFGIEEDSDDSRMLDLVTEALHYQRVIHPGDPVPKEMITGEASWEITEDHRRIAMQRLNVQLAGWMTGEDRLITDPEQLQQIAEDPTTRAKVNEAIGEAVKALNLEENGKEILLERIEALVDDLAGVEALRDYLDRIILIESKARGLRRLYAEEQSMLDIAEPVTQLVTLARSGFEDDFEMIDAQTGEIIAVLRNMEAQTKFIREMRDDLHQRLVEWEEIFETWGPVRVARSDENANVLRISYRFLAPRYMQVDEWDLHSKVG